MNKFGGRASKSCGCIEPNQRADPLHQGHVRPIRERPLESVNKELICF